MIRMTLLPLMLAGTLCQAAETVKVYNWSDYIAPDTMKNFQRDTGIAFSYDLDITFPSASGWASFFLQTGDAPRVDESR